MFKSDVKPKQIKCIRFIRKDRLKNIRGTTRKVAMLADVSDAHIAISSFYQCATGPLRHELSSLPLDVLDSDWSTKC